MTPVLPLHLGALHPVEQALTIALAFGPFVLLGLVVWLRRREDDRIDAGGTTQGTGRHDPDDDAESDGAGAADGLRRASRPPPAAGP